MRVVIGQGNVHAHHKPIATVMGDYRIIIWQIISLENSNITNDIN